MREGSSIGRKLGPLVLVAALAAMPPAALGQTCGNSATEGDEQCDDGNTDGGDGCAANCTEETRHPCHFIQATLTFQVDMGALMTPVRGVQTLTIGRARASDPSGEIPFVVRADDIAFDNQPIVQLGLCSCVRAVPDAALGPGMVARGRIGCGAGLSPVDYTTTIDHNTHLNDPDPDPQCLNGTVETASQPHPGACNGSSQTNADVDGSTGSVTVLYSLTNYVFPSPELCSSIGPGAPERLQGADGDACTADDPQWSPSLLSATTGRVTNRIFHVRNSASVRERTEAGTTVSCTQLMRGSDPERALEEMVLVASANTELDAPVNDDIVATFRFACSAEAPTATPTATSTPTLPPPTPTATGTPTATSPIDPSPTPTARNTPTSTSTSGTLCGGDCDGNHQVRVDELVRGVNIALERAQLDTCRSFDGNGDGIVRVNELVTGVNSLLRGCPG
jgi:cysteine-rich repeat protein